MSSIMAGIYEPVLSYQFKVFLVPTATDTKNEKLIKDASDALGFSEISMGSNETEIYEYQEGGENTFTHSFPSATKAGKLTLSHGLSSDSTMGTLRQMITNAEDKYEAGIFAMAIGMFSYPNSNPSFWYFTDVWISKMEVGGFKTGTSDVIIESMELVVKRAELEIAKGGGKTSNANDLSKILIKKKEEREEKKKEEREEKKKKEEEEKKKKEEEEKKKKEEEEKNKKPKQKPDDGWQERNRVRREKQVKKIEDAQKKKGNKNYKKNTYDGTLDNPAEQKKLREKKAKK